MGGIQSNISDFAATILLCTAENWFIQGKIPSPPPPVSSSVLDVLHCVRGNHEESIVMKLKNYAEVERKYV